MQGGRAQRHGLQGCDLAFGLDLAKRNLAMGQQVVD